MIRRPPRSTRTDTLFPYTTLFRSRSASPTSTQNPRYASQSPAGAETYDPPAARSTNAATGAFPARSGCCASGERGFATLRRWRSIDATPGPIPEERRGGKGCVSTCRSRGSKYTENTKDKNQPKKILQETVTNTDSVIQK